MSEYELFVGDCREELKRFEENTFHSCVTDPPYGLKFMGKKWDYQVPSVDHWTAVYRVLRPGAHLLAFGGTRTYHRLVCAIEDAGFEIRDQIAWVYGQGFPKSHNITDELGTALKPALEPIVVARKPLDGTVEETYNKWGIGVLRIDACRISGEPWTFGTQTDIRGGNFGTNRPTDGHVLAKNIVGGQKGRWPANLIHDGSPEVLGCFPSTKSGKPGTRRKNHETDAMSGRLALTGNVETGYGDEGNASRFFYCAKTSRRDRNEGCEHREDARSGFRSNTSGQHITRRDPEYNPLPQKNDHPTVKPTALMQYLCKLITPPEGRILDPFLGSGSTGKAAMYERYKFVGIDLTEKNIQIADARIQFALNDKEPEEIINQLDLF